LSFQILHKTPVLYHRRILLVSSPFQ